jgi:hypothetical protein
MAGQADAWGRCLRLLLIGDFEALDAEPAIVSRAADSFALRECLGLVLPAAPPDHSTISRTRRLICRCSPPDRADLTAGGHRFSQPFSCPAKSAGGVFGHYGATLPGERSINIALYMGGLSFRAVRGRATVAHSPDSPARRL